MEGVPEDKLLYSFHRFLSCPILGIGKTFEETSIRYTAFVCFFFSFFLFQLFPSTFSLPHTKNTSQIRASPNLRETRHSALAVDSDTFLVC